MSLGYTFGLTNDQIKDACVEKGLSTTGRKHELLFRLRRNEIMEENKKKQEKPKYNNRNDDEEPPLKRKCIQDIRKEILDEKIGSREGDWVQIGEYPIQLTKYVKKSTSSFCTGRLTISKDEVYSQTTTNKMPKYNIGIPVSPTKMYFIDNNYELVCIVDSIRNRIFEELYSNWSYFIKFEIINKNSGASMLAEKLNVKRFTHLIDEGFIISKRSQIIKYIEEINKNLLSMKSNFNKLNVTQTLDSTLNLDSLSKIKIPLYDYQINNIKWMNSVESNSNQSILIKNILKFSDIFKINSMDHILNLDDQTFHSNDQQIGNKMQFKGGILADEMGLGKTLCMLSLIACKEFNDKKEEFNYLNIKNGVIQNFNSKSTLIVCPIHLMKQWEDEINEKTSLSYIKISDPMHLLHLTYKDILDTDIVLSSIFLFEGARYLKQSLSHDRTSNIPRLMKNAKLLFSDFAKNPKAIEFKSPMLHCIHWNRIVIDEGHELMKTNKLEELLGSIQSTYRWYISGTPFLDKSSFLHALHFLGMENQLSYNNNIKDFVLFHLYRRNTKCSVKNQIFLGSLDEKIYLVQPTCTEIALLKDKPMEEALRICCHPQIDKFNISLLGSDSSLSLDEIRDKLLSHENENLINLQKK